MPFDKRDIEFWILDQDQNEKITYSDLLKLERSADAQIPIFYKLVQILKSRLLFLASQPEKQILNIAKDVQTLMFIDIKEYKMLISKHFGIDSVPILDLVRDNIQLASENTITYDV